MASMDLKTGSIFEGRARGQPGPSLPWEIPRFANLARLVEAEGGGAQCSRLFFDKKLMAHMLSVSLPADMSA